MKGLLILRILIIASMLALPLVAVTPALADTPGHWVDSIDETDTWLAADNPCGFDIVKHQYGTFRGNYWLDENGQVTREIVIYGNLKYTFAANGKSLNMLIQGPAHFEYTSENQYFVSLTGTNTLITAPGYGKIYGGTGLLVVEVTLDPITGEPISEVVVRQAGNALFDDLSTFCEYLSP